MVAISTKANKQTHQVFFNAKSDELIGLYTDAPSQEKTKAIAMLNRMDAQRANAYRAIMGR